MKCAKARCKNAATQQIGYKAWALGYPKTDSNCIAAFTSICVCDNHAEDTAGLKRDILNPEACAIVNNKLQEIRRASLDFAGAEIIFHQVIDGKPYMPTK